MSGTSAIEWTEATWNPVTGCSKVSAGCDHCYAEALTMRHAENWGVPRLPWTPENAAENVILRPPEPWIDWSLSLDLEGIDWLIVGGESGPRHRRIAPDWVRELRDVAEVKDTAFFFKQWGGRTPKAGGRELDGRTWDEMPSVGAQQVLA